MPGRTRVEVALAGHVAADRDQRRRPERELLGAEQRGDQQVPTGLQATVGAQRDAIAQVVPQQDLVHLGQPELPRRADVLDRRQRRGAGPAGVAGQVDVGRAGLGHTCGDRPDAARRDELDADPGARVDRPQVGDELGEVLDRVDVVVRRRADVALPGLAAPQRGDVGGRLATGQLAALARLRTLGDLDLELVGAREICRGHPEPRRRDLLDPGVASSAVRRPARTRPDPRRPRRCSRRPPARWMPIVSAWWASGDSAPTLIAETTNRRAIDRASSTSSKANGIRKSSHAQLVARVAGVACRPTPAPTRYRVERGRRCETSSPVGVAPDSTWISLAIRGANRCASPSPRNRANPGSGNRASRPGWRLGQCERSAASPDDTRAKVDERRPPGPRSGAREAALDDVRREVDRVDQRSADVARDRADAHPRQRLAQAGRERLDQVLDRSRARQRPRRHATRRARRPARARAADGRRSRRLRASSPSHGRRARRRHRRRGRSGRAVRPVSTRCGLPPPPGSTAPASRSIDNAASLMTRTSTPASAAASASPASLSRARPSPSAPSAAGHVASDIANPPAASRERADKPTEVRDDRALEPQRARPARRPTQQCRPSTELDPQVHHDPLALRVDRRVRDLRERLAQVVGDRPIESPSTRGRRVVAHAPQRLVAPRGPSS